MEESLDYDKDIIVMGDTHGDFSKLNTHMNKRRAKIYLQCGDFGYWPNCVYDRGGWAPKTKPPPDPKVPEGSKLYFCDGNHEDHWALKELVEKGNLEPYPRTFYQPRGSTITLPDGRVVLFVGGAYSIDRNHRILGSPTGGYFPEETITQEQVMNIGDIKVDIVISHTVPKEFYVYGDGNDFRINDFSRMALSYVLEKYRPALWYAGHWHTHKTGYDHGCRWTILDMSWNSRWWEYLKK